MRRLELSALGPDYVRERNASVFTAECHVQYKRELRLDDPVRATIQLHRIRRETHRTSIWSCATRASLAGRHAESMNLHVDMTTRQGRALPARYPRQPGDHEGRPFRPAHARRRSAESSASRARRAGRPGVH